MTTESLACTLSGPELVERVKQWTEVMSRATSRHVEKGRILSTYPAETRLLQQLDALIRAEAECCPFMHFSIEESANELTVELRVPEEMSETLTVMLGAVAAPPVPSQST